jgi:ribosomal protein S18 acetylase RimI-like enzyme
MKIIEYKEEYLEEVKDLLVELEEYIISIDQDNLDIIHPEYREMKTILDLEELKDNGKCFIAIENNAVIGLIMGKIREYDKYDYLDYKIPKQGEITELIVSKKTRSKGVGQQLMKKLEEYFKSLDCEYILVDIFAYNDNALKFYHKQGFHPRMITSIKKI